MQDTTQTVKTFTHPTPERYALFISIAAVEQIGIPSDVVQVGEAWEIHFANGHKVAFVNGPLMDHYNI